MATTADRQMSKFIMDVLEKRGQAHVVDWAARPNDHVAQLGCLHQHGRLGHGECRPTTIQVLPGRDVPGVSKEVMWDPRQPWENAFEFTAAVELWYIKPFQDAVIRYWKKYEPEQQKTLHALPTAKDRSDFKKTIQAQMMARVLRIRFPQEPTHKGKYKPDRKKRQSHSRNQIERSKPRRGETVLPLANASPVAGEDARQSDSGTAGLPMGEPEVSNTELPEAELQDPHLSEPHPSSPQALQPGPSGAQSPEPEASILGASSPQESSPQPSDAVTRPVAHLPDTPRLNGGSSPINDLQGAHLLDSAIASISSSAANPDGPQVSVPPERNDEEDLEWLWQRFGPSITRMSWYHVKKEVDRYSS
ncbi:hypothetical protein PG985_009759 [Apiospora marii]|uniref:uncharacterized protein n=1 Tax=Apiospora marii TaxID=335849 RepID=UPI00312EE6B2